MTRKTNTKIPALASVGIDIGKEVFHVVGFSADGKIALRWKLKRLAFADAFKKLPPCIIGMEACLTPILRPQGSELQSQPSSRLTNDMERIDRRTQNLATQMAAR